MNKRRCQFIFGVTCLLGFMQPSFSGSGNSISQVYQAQSDSTLTNLETFESNFRKKADELDLDTINLLQNRMMKSRVIDDLAIYHLAEGIQITANLKKDSMDVVQLALSATADHVLNHISEVSKACILMAYPFLTKENLSLFSNQMAYFYDSKNNIEFTIGDVHFSMSCARDKNFQFTLTMSRY